MPKTPSPTATAEADLAALEKRRIGLDARKLTATGALVTATAERRRLLVEHDNPPAAELAKADRACRDARDSDDAAADALAELDRRIAGARDLVERLTTADRRDREAKAIEASADKAAAALVRIQTAAAEIAAATGDLSAAILPTTSACYTPTALGGGLIGRLTTTSQFYDGRSSTYAIHPEDAALRLAGHALAAVLPGYAITTEDQARTLRGDGFPTPVLAPAADAAALDAALVAPMRAHAAAVRSGAAEVMPAVLPPPTWDELHPPLRRRQANFFKKQLDGTFCDRFGVVTDAEGYYPEGYDPDEGSYLNGPKAAEAAA